MPCYATLSGAPLIISSIPLTHPQSPPDISTTEQCPLTGFPLDYSYKEVSQVKGFLAEPPFAGVAKGMDRKSLPKGSELNACGVKLSNNRLTNLDGLAEFLEAVLDDPSELRWIDLSHNQLTRIDPVLFDYPKLSCVYLHGNQIASFKEVDKLANLGNLAKLTLHGNPVEELNSYRLHVPVAIPTLRSLDFIGITKLDRDKMNMFDRSRKAARERWLATH